MERFKNQAISRDLEGVTVILTPATGVVTSAPPTTAFGRADYVYDVLCRIKARLEKNTAAQVLTTIRDTQYGYRIFETQGIPLNQSESILTTPPLRLASSAPNDVGVNLRWYLANSYLRSLQRKGVDPDKVVFASLHADSLHPSLRGTMIYVPARNTGPRLTDSTEQPTGRAGRCGSRATSPSRIASSGRNPKGSPGVCRPSAEALKQRGARIHPYQPVRDRIIRRTRPWVPAVLPARSLGANPPEVCNINNPPMPGPSRIPPSGRRLPTPSWMLLSYYA